MTALEQKRQEYANSLQQLKQRKANEINQKVEVYRQQLLAAQKHDDEAKIQAVITALDQVIMYEKGNIK